MATIARRRVRLPLEATSFESVKDVLTTATPFTWRGNALGVEVVAMQKGVILDLSNFSSLTLLIKGAITDSTNLASQTLTAEDITPVVSPSDWAGGISQHAIFILTASQMNFALSQGEKNCYLVVGGVTNGGEPYTLGITRLKVLEDGIGSADETVAEDPSYLTEDQINALLLEFLRNDEPIEGQIVLADSSEVELLENELGVGGNHDLMIGTPSGNQFLTPGPLDIEVGGVWPDDFTFTQATNQAAYPLVPGFTGRHQFVPMRGIAIGSLGGTDPSSQLTSLKLWNVQVMGSLGGAYPACTSIEAPMLEYVTALSFTGASVLTSISMPKLKWCNGQIGAWNATVLTTLNLPELRYVGTGMPINAPALTTLSMPLLERFAGSVAIANLNALPTFSLPSLTAIIGALTFANMAACTTISLPAMVKYVGTITGNSGMGNLTSLTLGTTGTLKLITNNINFSGQNLDAASVNALLALLVSLDGTNGTTLWGSGRTLTISGGTNAAPTGQGITDKATLQGRGATITTN